MHHHELAEREKIGGKTCVDMEEVGTDWHSVDELEKQVVLPLLPVLPFHLRRA